MAQLMPLPLTVSCFSKIQIGFTFLVPAHPSSPGKRAVKRVCVCVSNVKPNLPNSRLHIPQISQKSGHDLLHYSANCQKKMPLPLAEINIQTITGYLQ